MSELTIDVKSAQAPVPGWDDGSGRIESPTASLWSSALAGGLCVALCVTASALFLPHQSIWLDEATQLSGLTLDPFNQVRWLSGRIQNPLGVCEDRMPPLSYLAGWIWSQAFGLNEVSMRWMGVVAVGLATLLIFLGAKHAWGTGPALAAGLLFGLSPNVTVMSVEIRAYPLFLLASAASYYCLIRLLTDPIPCRMKWLVGLTVCGVLATYVHFFGLVLAGGTMLAALVLVPARGGRIWPVLLASAIVGVLSLGIAPFVLASVGMSQGAEPAVLESKATGLVRLAYRLVSHATTLVSPVAVGAALVGALAAAVASLPRKEHSQQAWIGLLIAFVSGAGVVAASQFAQSKFASATTSYNVWMLPAVSLLLASGLGSATRLAQRTALLGVALMLTSDVYAQRQLAVNGEFFAHIPYRPLSTLIRKYGPERVAVIHDGSNAGAWMIHPPLRYEFARVLRQYAVDASEPGPLRVTAFPDPDGKTDPLALPAEYIIVIRADWQRSSDLVSEIRNGVHPLGDGPVAKALKRDERWAAISESTSATYLMADIDVFKRSEGTQAPVASGSADSRP